MLEYDSETESRSARPATVSTGWKDRLKPTPLGGESKECWPAKSKPENPQNIDHIVQKVLQLDMK